MYKKSFGTPKKFYPAISVLQKRLRDIFASKGMAKDYIRRDGRLNLLMHLCISFVCYVILKCILLIIHHSGIWWLETHGHSLVIYRKRENGSEMGISVHKLVIYNCGPLTL